MTDTKVTKSSFWGKVKSCFKKAGKPLIKNVLILWYAFPDASAADKAVILGALAYFISPLDAIPDVLPGGFADDAGVVALAVIKVRLNASPEAIAKAEAVADDWFGKD